MNPYVTGQEVKKMFGEKPKVVRHVWKYDLTDGAGFNALCRIHGYRITRGKVKADGKSEQVIIECSCGLAFQFRNHWQCQKATDNISDEE
jgi:hypothetical protein